MESEQKHVETKEGQSTYEQIAEVAGFIHDRLGNVEDPTGLNNTVEEYAKHEGEQE